MQMNVKVIDSFFYKWLDYNIIVNNLYLLTSNWAVNAIMFMQKLRLNQSMYQPVSKTLTSMTVGRSSSIQWIKKPLFIPRSVIELQKFE